MPPTSEVCFEKLKFCIKLTLFHTELHTRGPLHFWLEHGTVLLPQIGLDSVFLNMSTDETVA